MAFARASKYEHLYIFHSKISIWKQSNSELNLDTMILNHFIWAHIIFLPNKKRHFWNEIVVFFSLANWPNSSHADDYSLVQNICRFSTERLHSKQVNLSYESNMIIFHFGCNLLRHNSKKIVTKEMKEFRSKAGIFQETEQL